MAFAAGNRRVRVLCNWRQSVSQICTASWQPKICRENLELLTSVGISLPGLDEGIAELKEAEEFLPH
jgi:hypothetical protein